MRDSPHSIEDVWQLLAERRQDRLEHLSRSRWSAADEVSDDEQPATGARRSGDADAGAPEQGAGRDEHQGPPWLHAEHWRHSRLINGPRRPGPLRRGLSDRLVGGVAAGVSSRTGVDANILRGAFVVSTLIGGFGIAAYVLAWLSIPLEGDDRSVASRAITDRRGIALALAIVPLLVLTLLVASALGATWMKTVAWPLFLAAGGLVLVIRNVSTAERSLLEQSFGPIVALGTSSSKSRRLLVGRIALALACALTGGVLLTHDRPNRGVIQPAGSLILIALGVVIAFGPWWVRLVRDLVEERQARARAEERSDIAARIHDSVLQTLALIQRHSNDPHQVVALARAQERELRAWLFEGRVPGSVDSDATVAVAVEHIQMEVESLFGVPVEAVVVGDCKLDDDLQSLLEAAREATVNAAKWSGAPEISFFAEVETGAVEIYVRDRGKGFDETVIAPDRRGVAESIRGRMARHGGHVELRSAPGQGTEITLTMPRR